jgi:hypothetical protein
MAERFKRFDGKQSDDGEPVTFGIGDEVFTCLHAIPAHALSRLGDVWTVGDMRHFIEGVLIDDDVVRFGVTLERKDIIITTAELSDIVVWLVEAISDRPTVAPSGSTNGRGGTKRSGVAASGTQAATQT